MSFAKGLCFLVMAVLGQASSAVQYCFQLAHQDRRRRDSMPHFKSILPLEKVDRRVYGVLQAFMALLALGYLGFAIHQYVTNGTVVGSDFPFFWVVAHIASAQDLQLAYSGELFSLEAAQERWGDSIQGNFGPIRRTFRSCFGR